MQNPIRVRFAPSPTGYLHVGGARTALYNYLFAKKNQGSFILRVEDTDQERSSEDSLKLQIEDLQWLGLKWDEGPDPVTRTDVGNYGPYRQSQRLDIYKTHIDTLIKQNKAFYCFMTDSELEAIKEKAISEGRPGQVKSPYRDMSFEDAHVRVAKGDKAVVRFKVPDKETIYKIKDLVRGEVEFPTSMIGDFVLVRSDGMPVYNFCCVVDDALMKITHVFRAEEHLSNTLRQLLLYEAFDYPLPEFGHISIILGPDKQKLSKRHGATSVGQYRSQGYIPEATNNFLALLGWSSPSGDEILSMDQMIKEFDSSRLVSSPAVFDEIKFKWMNATHLRSLESWDLWCRLQPFLSDAKLQLSQDKNWIKRTLEVFKSYMETLGDAVSLFTPLDSAKFSIADEAKEVLGWPSTVSVIEEWKSLLKDLKEDYLVEEKFVDLQNQVMKNCSVKGKNLFMPLRVAVIGKPHGAELKLLVPLIPRLELIKRADRVVGSLQQS